MVFSSRLSAGYGGALRSPRCAARPCSLIQQHWAAGHGCDSRRAYRLQSSGAGADWPSCGASPRGRLPSLPPTISPLASQSTIAVFGTLSAEWPLLYKNMDELVVKAEALKQRIADADVTGTKDAATRRSQAESAGDSDNSSSSDDGQPSPPAGPYPAPGPYAPSIYMPVGGPGVPTFVYVARVTPQHARTRWPRPSAKRSRK